MRRKDAAIRYLADDTPSDTEVAYLKLLAEAINALGYHHRRKLKRKVGHWYRVEVTFEWPADGILNIDLLEVRELPARPK